MLSLLILGCLLANVAPAPFPADDYSEYPDDQVEVLGGPFSSQGESSYPQEGAEGDGDGVIRVYVVRARPTFRISGFPDIFGSQDGIGFNQFGLSSGGEQDAETIPFGGNGGFNLFDILGGGGEGKESNSFGGEGGFNPFSILGGGERDAGGFNPFSVLGKGGEEDAELFPVGEEGGCNHCGGGRNPFHNGGGGGEDDCGPLCLIFKLLNGLQVEIDDINNKKNEVEAVEGDGEYDVNDSTYKEKVLPDGSILKTNRTTIADTDQDGNSFIFKSTVIHNLDSGEDTTATDEDPEQDDEIVTDVTADYPTEEEEETSGEDELPEVLHKSPEFDDIPDPAENEITGSESDDGIDDGLLALKRA